MDGHRTGPPRGTGEQNPAYRATHQHPHARRQRGRADGVGGGRDTRVPGTIDPMTPTWSTTTHGRGHPLRAA